MIVKGFIKDKDTGAPIPYASIRALDENDYYSGNGSVSNANGIFIIDANDTDKLAVSSVGYTTITQQLYPDFLIDWNNVVLLQKASITLPGVVLPPAHKQNYAWLMLLPILAIAGKKKAVTGINTGTMLTIGAGFLLLQGMGIFTKLIDSIGLGGNPTTPEQSNPNSAWKPSFWQSIPDGTPKLLITESFATDWTETIHDAFGLTEDDFNEILNVFSQLKTKSQVSYLSDKFQQRYGADLLSFLTDGGGILPWDGLSKPHLKILLDYVDKLPNYMP